MKVKRISKNKYDNEWLEVTTRIYADDPNWYTPYERDSIGLFSPITNSHFNHGMIIRWILYDDKNKPAGRIAAFINNKGTHSMELRTGGIAYFECINSEEGAFLLFDAAKKWLISREMESMEGPINFGSKDKWWGLLTTGFNEERKYASAYNPPYYKDLFVAYGFYDYYYGNVYCLNLKEPNLSLKQTSNPTNDVKVLPLNKSNYKAQEDDMQDLYNACIQQSFGLKKSRKDSFKNQLSRMSALWQDNLAYVAFNGNSLVGMLLLAPDISPMVKALKGQMGFFARYKFNRMVRKKVSTRLILYGCYIHPNYLNTGLEETLFNESYKSIKAINHYKEIEFVWTGSYNKVKGKMVEKSGASLKRINTVFRMEFDPGAEHKTIMTIE